MRVYLAGPLFSEAERDYLESVADRLEAEGIEVFVPHRHTIDPLTPANVFAVDAGGVRDAHAVLAWLDGPMVDDGTACEIGMFAQLCATDPGAHAGIVGLVTDLRSFRRHAAGLPDAGVNLFVAGAIESCGKVALSLDGAVAQLLAWRTERGW